MFRLTVRDRVMIAHSFQGEVFGPAQGVHGATYVDEHNLVVDIGLAHVALAKTLQQLNYKNLDELPVFEGQNTTTEFLAQWVWGEIRDAIQAGELGSHSLCELGVTLRESDVAWASYDAPLA